MKGEEFVRKLETVFGEYRPGMRVFVQMHANDLSVAFQEKLFIEIVRTHDSNWPPPLAAILKVENALAEIPPVWTMLEEPEPTEEDKKKFDKVMSDLKEKMK